MTRLRILSLILALFVVMSGVPAYTQTPAGISAIVCQERAQAREVFERWNIEKDVEKDATRLQHVIADINAREGRPACGIGHVMPISETGQEILSKGGEMMILSHMDFLVMLGASVSPDGTFGFILMSGSGYVLYPQDQEVGPEGAEPPIGGLL